MEQDRGVFLERKLSRLQLRWSKDFHSRRVLERNMQAGWAHVARAANYLQRDILASLTKANTPLPTVRKFARKTRSYLRACMKSDASSHAKVEALQ
jgi:hypothetical protein